MKLAAYLTNHDISVAKFASEIGVSSTSVHRYLAGDRVPKRKLMLRIRELTDGAVTADDFFESDPRPDHEASQEARAS